MGTAALRPLEAGSGAPCSSVDLDPTPVLSLRDLGVRVTLTSTPSGDIREPEDPEHLDARLVALSRERGPLRVVAAWLASHLVVAQSWERLGYARLSDYAAERLGVSSRSVQSLAQVGHRLRRSPHLKAALASGALGWTKVRLLAQLPESEDLAHWVAHARRVRAADLAKAVRRVDAGSIEAGALEARPRGRLFEVRCTPEVRRKWAATLAAARRVGGGRLPVGEAAELIAAEAVSAFPLEESGEPEDDEATPWGEAAERGDRGAASKGVVLPWRGSGESGAPAPRDPTLPPELESLVEDLESADAFVLDARLRRVLSLEQRLEARLGPWLLRVWGSWAHRALGYVTRESYVRERLGMDPTRARALLRLERRLAGCPDLARAYRSGALSWVKASALSALAREEGAPLGAWVSWAGRISVRRLRDDVEHALTLAETEPEAFRHDLGLPAEAHREIGAAHTASETDAPEPAPPRVHRGFAVPVPEAGEREIGATHRDWVMGRWHHGPSKKAPDETCFVRFIGPADVVRLFDAVVCTVQRQREHETGTLPTPGQALDAILDHVLESWGVLGEKIAKRYAVFARDGWRCAAPGCTSMRNLHDHHIRFRSAGGSNDLANRVTLCPPPARDSPGSAALRRPGARPPAVEDGAPTGRATARDVPIGGRTGLTIGQPARGAST